MSETKNKLSREEQAHQEFAATTGSHGIHILLVILFVVVLLAVPFTQVTTDLVQYFQGSRPDAVPESIRLAPLAIEAGKTYRAAEGNFASRVSDANRAVLREIGTYETRLEDNSWLTELVLPQAQFVFTKVFRLGNEKAYVGVDGDLFYRPDIDFVCGRGFLDPEQIHRRRLADTSGRIPVEPNPLPAILSFHEELESMGIRLIVMPVPAKLSMQASGLYAKYPAEHAPPQNPSYDDFISVLRENGVNVFDCRDVLLASEEGAFLKQDTHWKPEIAEDVAKQLARTIEEMGVLETGEPIGYTHRKTGAANHGDIAALLRLNPSANLFPLERVKFHQVIGPDKQLWVRSADAEVLLLGDSFTNIFSIPSLNWGRSAGLAEQLSFYLQRPLDRISFNDNGSYATRRELARRQASGQQPLAGKKVVVWEFAARELAQGDWQPYSLK